MKKIILLLVLVSLSCSKLLDPTPEPKVDPKLTINIYGGKDYDSVSKVFVNGEEVTCTTGEGDVVQVEIKKLDTETEFAIKVETGKDHEFFGFSGVTDSKEKEISFTVSSMSILNIDFGLKTDLVKEIIPINGVYEINNSAELRWVSDKSVDNKIRDNYDNKTIKLMKDIDLRKVPFLGFANFYAVFDGNNKTIKNIRSAHSDRQGTESFIMQLGNIVEMENAKFLNTILEGELRCDEGICIVAPVIYALKGSMISNVVSRLDVYGYKATGLVYVLWDSKLIDSRAEGKAVGIEKAYSLYGEDPDSVGSNFVMGDVINSTHVHEAEIRDYTK